MCLTYTEWTSNHQNLLQVDTLSSSIEAVSQSQPGSKQVVEKVNTISTQIPVISKVCTGRLVGTKRWTGQRVKSRKKIIISVNNTEHLLAGADKLIRGMFLYQRLCWLLWNIMFCLWMFSKTHLLWTLMKQNFRNNDLS